MQFNPPQIIGSTLAMATLLGLGTPIGIPYLDGQVSLVYGFVVAPALMLGTLCLSVMVFRGSLAAARLVVQARSAIRFQRRCRCRAPGETQAATHAP